MKLKLFILIISLINIISFSIMGIDKRKAQKSKLRIKESTLILSAFLFGGIGSFAGMQFFRHKTKHIRFLILVPAAVILNIGVFVLMYIKMIK